MSTTIRSDAIRVRLTKADHSALKAACAAAGTTISEALRFLVADWLLDGTTPAERARLLNQRRTP